MNPMLQTWVSTALVLGCALYLLWVLVLPRRWRQRLWQALVSPWPTLHGRATPPSGCGMACGGCTGRSLPAADPVVQRVQVVQVVRAPSCRPPPTGGQTG